MRNETGDRVTGVPKVVELLRRELSCPVHTGRRRSRWSTDFGAIVHQTPLAVVEAASGDDVVRTLDIARATGTRITLRGSGHCCNGQALSDGGIVVRLVPSADPVRLLDGDRVEVDGGATWWRIERRLNRAGRSIPVLPDYLPLSVGGTLSVGAYGLDSIRFGGLVDQVERLGLILPDGERRWCSAEESPELFRFTLAGLGRVGVIETAVLRTEPYRRFTTLFTYGHRSLGELVDSLEWMVDERQEGPEMCKALYTPAKSVATYGAGAATLRAALRLEPPPQLRAARRRARLVLPGYRFWRSRTVSAWITRFRFSYKLWSDYFLDLPALRVFARHLDELLRSDAFAGALASVYIVPIRRPPSPIHIPLAAPAGGGAGLRFGIGLYSMVPRRRPDSLRRVQAAVRSCLERCLELGGRPYLYGWHSMTGDEQRDVLGADHRALADLRRCIDPDDILGTPKILSE